DAIARRARPGLRPNESAADIGVERRPAHAEPLRRFRGVDPWMLACHLDCSINVDIIIQWRIRWPYGDQRPGRSDRRDDSAQSRRRWTWGTDRGRVFHLRTGGPPRGAGSR